MNYLSSDAYRNPDAHYRGFWQINIGHILTTVSVISSLGFMYGQVATRLENQQGEILQLQQTSIKMETSISTIQINEASSAQDRIDLHKTIEDDFSRRLSKLEDRLK